MSVRILGIDSAYCNTGLSLISWDGTTAELVTSVTIVTEASQKKRNTLVVDDHLRRVREIRKQIDDSLHMLAPDMVAMEALSTSRNAGSAVRQGMAYAVTIVCCGALPLVQYTPQAVRAVMIGHHPKKGEKVTKDDVARAVAKLLPLCGCQPRTEHEWDAAAVALVARDTDIARAYVRANAV
jgi:Holliday junction resolvasome RuvABC endonuclease subunit